MMNKGKKRAESGKLLTQAYKPAGLINYQEVGVVSRTLIDKNTETMTLFAFDEVQGLSEHAALYDALVQ